MRITTPELFNRGLNGISDLQQSIFKYQQQISSGKRLLQPSDDPVAAAQELTINERTASIEQHARNSNLAGLRMDEQQNAISSSMNALQRIRDMLVASRNGSLTPADLKSNASEVRQRLSELVSLANTRNASGEYIFAGSAVTTQAYSMDVNLNVSYNGNQTTREIPIAEGRTITEGFAGNQVYGDIRNGNGTFVTALGATNTGTGRLVSDSVVNPAAYVADNFSINFTAPNTFDVVDTTTGATVLAAQTYVDGQAITFNGISVSITGSPAATDTFTLTPSQNQSVFRTVKNAITTLETTLSTDAARAAWSFTMDRNLADVDQAMENLNAVRTSLGARQNALDAQSQTNDDLKTQLATIKSGLEDTDITSAVSKLSQQTNALNAAQAAFVRVQGLSLFNYLR
ncbi:MAG: flagellar hook-associated protein FlgL [Gammaproteobacteria bacterium]|nr:flagellar hook-associated protein FlgL [Gammaproteobacteria bacterium]